MVAYSFKAQFADLVATGRKRQAIRAPRKRHARPGEPIQLYTGMRTKACRKLVEPDPVCRSVEPISIKHGHVLVGEHPVTWEDTVAFAHADGFNSVAAFLDFFDALPSGDGFQGVLIKW